MIGWKDVGMRHNCTDRTDNVGKKVRGWAEDIAYLSSFSPSWVLNLWAEPNH